MPLNQLFYPDSNKWDAGPIYGGWLAGERDNEAGLARLMQMYEAAQGIKKQQQDYNYNEQINPLNIQGKGLANTTAQQTIDINQPKAAKALAQVNDPNWLPGEMESDRLKGQAEDAKNTKQRLADVEDTALAAIDQIMSGLNSGKLSALPSLEGLPDNFKQIITQAVNSENANWNLNTLREGLMQRRAERAYVPKKLEREEQSRSAAEVARIGAESRVASAGLRQGNVNRLVKNAEQAYLASKEAYRKDPTPENQDKMEQDYADWQESLVLKRQSPYWNIPGATGIERKEPQPGVAPPATRDIATQQKPDGKPTSGKMSDGTTWKKK